ncbi:hypothetical protein VOLCADRAFT_88456 [Volvox carteri f. nagariensis]|uniref:J domain-containing protein n=1 Tax=Volvox carteri f. nagariensis TaxID=3068 RepID=D8TP17_VOLCA|nr:uncharacterized protein VOLCADRAFT_88456 [Volvox carteri f. nagariensis]EFJ50682.1 hypothetical protein VOLCADRAFT_88456 [Volvox carteri f. nagariensis]|eukprot:XP_002948275.1 hypothetical protein VOLCADRAFT_88456 [Volvox carteri f. nagariensis]
MSARGIVTFIGRRRRELSSFCVSSLPVAADSPGDAIQPSTSAPAYEQVVTPIRHLWARRSNPAPAASVWRSVHHDHQHCGGKSHQHKHHGASRRPISLEDVEKACWSCDKLVKRGGLVCHGCETIQPPDESLNYFELFSLPETSFDISPQLLERRYKQLQWNLHPDKMGHKPAEEQEFSAQQASIVNLAYSILKSPLSRANYLLALRGINAGDNFEGTFEDHELLMEGTKFNSSTKHTPGEVMEAREEVENTDDPAALSALLGHNRKQQEKLVSALSAAFRADDMEAAVTLTNKLQYVAKLEQEIVKKLPQL